MNVRYLIKHNPPICSIRTVHLHSHSTTYILAMDVAVMGLKIFGSATWSVKIVWTKDVFPQLEPKEPFAPRMGGPYNHTIVGENPVNNIWIEDPDETSYPFFYLLEHRLACSQTLHNHSWKHSLNLLSETEVFFSENSQNLDATAKQLYRDDPLLSLSTNVDTEILKLCTHNCVKKIVFKMCALCI